MNLPCFSATATADGQKVLIHDVSWFSLSVQNRVELLLLLLLPGASVQTTHSVPATGTIDDEDVDRKKAYDGRSARIFKQHCVVFLP